MKVIPYLAEQLGTAIAGGVEFAAMKSLVKDIESSSLNGAEKRAKVLEDFQAIGYELAGWVVNTLLELAVVWVRASI